MDWINITYFLLPRTVQNEKAGFGEKEDGSRNELEGLSTGLVLILFSVLAFLRKGQSLTPACSFQELSLMWAVTQKQHPPSSCPFKNFPPLHCWKCLEVTFYSDSTAYHYASWLRERNTVSKLGEKRREEIPLVLHLPFLCFHIWLNAYFSFVAYKISSGFIAPLPTVPSALSPSGGKMSSTPYLCATGR